MIINSRFAGAQTLSVRLLHLTYANSNSGRGTISLPIQNGHYARLTAAPTFDTVIACF